MSPFCFPSTQALLPQPCSFPLQLGWSVLVKTMELAAMVGNLAGRCSEVNLFICFLTTLSLSLPPSLAGVSQICSEIKKLKKKNQQ
jgi:hypothetical protein